MKRRRLLSAILVTLCCAAAPAYAQKPPVAPARMLPSSFAGWTSSGTLKTGTDPQQVDAAQAGVLKEDGFHDYESAAYTREGRKLTVTALRFDDATGAYAAFTFYREPRMQLETIGAMAASANDLVIFFCDNILVRAQFDHVTEMSAAELRELVTVLPPLKGAKAVMPTLPSYLPRDGMTKNSARFIVGPVAYGALALPVSAQAMDFSRSPEILSANFHFSTGDGTLMLIEYPTPQIAIERIRLLSQTNPGAGPTFVTRRSGPIVALAYGSFSEGDARALLGAVNYEAEVTWNEDTGLSRRNNIGNLVIAACVLALVIILISLGFGLIFGFTRPLLARVFPGRFRARKEGDDFIRLHLD